MYDKKKSHCVCSGKSSEDETLLSFEKVKCFNPVNYNWGYLDATSRLSIASKLGIFLLKLINSDSVVTSYESR
jgi:hypothetical protein